MNGIEALQALKNGMKVRRDCWDDDKFLFFNKNECQIYWGDGVAFSCRNFLYDFKWEIFNLVKFKDVPELSKICHSRKGDDRMVWTKIKMNDCVNAIAPKDKLAIDFIGGFFNDNDFVEVLPNVEEKNYN